ncbi:MAG: hypothetical protein YPKNTGVA_000118 [Candidatus Fervidibacter sp.]
MARSRQAYQPLALSWRDLYRLVYLRHAAGLVAPKELLGYLRKRLPFRDWSLWRLRRWVARALQDPRCDALLSVTVLPPRCGDLERHLCRALPEVCEAIIIPSLADLDPLAQDIYLGLAAAMTFCPRFQDGQGIGFSGGRSVAAMAMAFASFLPSDIALRFYALHRPNEEVFGFTAEGIVSELIARRLWMWGQKAFRPHPTNWVGNLDPSTVKPEALDWCFLAVQPLTEEGRKFSSPVPTQKPVAEMLGHLFCPDGLPPSSLPLYRGQTISLGVLRKMVRDGRTVVLFAKGEQGASALSALFRARFAGGPLFNAVVTDEVCARNLLRQLGEAEPERGEKGWQRKRQQFFAAHLRFAATERCRTHQEIAQRLRLNPHTVGRLLYEAQWSASDDKPLLRLQVTPPFPQPTEWLDWEMALLRELDLAEVRVVQPVRDEWAYRSVGEAAAQLLLEWLATARHFSVGLGAGRAVRSFVEALRFPHLLKTLPKLQSLTFWALHSGIFQPITLSIGSEHLLHSIAMRCFGAEDAERVQCRRWRPDLSPHFDAIFVSVGVLDDMERAYLQTVMGVPAERMRRAVGTILNQPFDAEGQAIPIDLPQTVTLFPLERLQKLAGRGVPVVAIACGAAKAPAILAAWRGKFFNCLVTDLACAERIASEEGRAKGETTAKR